MRDRPPRRRVLIGATLAAAALAGCGFQLRRPPELQLKRVALTGIDAYSPMGEELRRQLRASPGAVVVASTAAGQVRELTLRARLRFRVHTPAGRELIAPTELMLTRDMSYVESAALAKAQEAALLFDSMHTDLAAQVLRRLAVLGPV